MRLLDNSRHLLRVWRANARTSIVREMEFRSNFVLGIIRQGSWVAAFIFMVEIIFHNTASLNGWSKPEVLVILSLSRMIEGLIDIFVSRNIAMLPQTVQKGELDLFLVKPLPVQFAVAFQKFHFYNLGNVAAGIILFVYALATAGTLPSPTAWFQFLALVAISLVIFYSFLILIASLVFFFERLEALYGFMTLFTEPLTVPFDIFPRTPRLLMTYVLPIAFIVFVPAQAITEKLAPWQLPVAAAVGLVFLLAANVAWRAGIRRYSSASS